MFEFRKQTNRVIGFPLRDCRAMSAWETSEGRVAEANLDWMVYGSNAVIRGSIHALSMIQRSVKGLCVIWGQELLPHHR